MFPHPHPTAFPWRPRKSAGPTGSRWPARQPSELRPQRMPVSVRSALLAAWSRPPPVLYGLGAGCLSGAVRDTGPVQSHGKGILIVSLPPLSQPPLLHCVRAWVYSVLFAVSSWSWFSGLGGWEVREGPLQAPVPPTCSYRLREAQRARGTKPMYVFGPNMVRPALPVCVSCHPPIPPRL